MTLEFFNLLDFSFPLIPGIFTEHFTNHLNQAIIKKGRLAATLKNL